VLSIHRTFIYRVRTDDTLVGAEKRLIKMFPWVRISLLDNYGFLHLAFDLVMYCNFMVSCNRKFKSYTGVLWLITFL